ncbi:filamentous haemagglutinin family protein [Methylomonas sp. ZR1]|uniref:filamentous haemagglutinin family protein n=1 Tax=Methylomonas sp. ZR1 TaxID=1797072 RepID=UPI001492958F|nr:filamentous haemagglutinin family protein [Methylomonas sp. ZR1]NOV28800.1 filamentous hemagglutinin N-terminal domain-containing protein [Methylomonas sp. ZR1]
MTNRQQHQHGDAVFFRLNPIAACVKSAVAGSMLIAFVSPVCAELPVPSAVWASMGGASRSVIGNNMTINQETDRVILNWDKFNVSADSSVEFKQPSASAIALNKIVDPSKNPSQILGSVTANGQIYLVNKNGFVFGRDSVVNARGLVASTMDVSFEKTFDKETIGTVSKDGRAAFVGSGDYYQKNTDGSFKLDANGQKVPIEIKVESGARIKSGEGGRILVIAPSIMNKGDVESPGGQVIMAAATDKVYLQEAPTADDRSNNDVRGLLVEVETGGKVENLGNIAANRGNVTLMGFAVKQSGKVSATTSTNVNGTIRLLAREGFTTKTEGGETVIAAKSTTRTTDKGDGLGRSAQVTLGAGSTTEILPEVEYIEETQNLESGETVKVLVEKTAVPGQVQPQSRVEIMADKVHLQAGSEINAPSGKVSITATKSPLNPVADNSQKNDSRILIDAGAKIDVSGTDKVIRTMESNVLEVELRNFELKDAPLQKTGILKGKTVLVDIREGTPLTDIEPTVAGIGRTVAERMVNGGEIVLNSEGDVILEKGAVLDFSGGELTYLDGFITTSKLLANGRLVDISEADPLVPYEAIYGEVVKKYQKWGITKVWKIDGPFTLARFEPGYVEGQDAGSLMIRANNAILDGELLGKTTNGRRQRTLAEQAKGSRLTVDTAFTLSNAQALIFSAGVQNSVDLDIDEVFPVGNDGLAMALAVDANKLIDGGVHTAVFKTNGNISLAENATLRLAAGGNLTLQGGAIDVRGNIVGAGATVKLETAETNAPGLQGEINLASGATIDLRGEWINDFAQPENLDGKTVAIDGGSFIAKAKGNGGGVNLRAGSLIDISAGAWLHEDRKLEAGKAQRNTGEGDTFKEGGIVLVAEPAIDKAGANVLLDGVMHAYAMQQGGGFTVKANAVAIRREETPSIGDGGVQPLQIATTFFGEGGFAEFDIGANLNGLTVEDGVNIQLRQQNRVLNNTYLEQANADGIGAFADLTTLLPELRAPSKLTLRADHAAGINANSNLLVAATATINADDLSSVTLESDSSLVLDGRIVAHGGTVALDIIPDQSEVDPQYQQNQGIWLGSTARIDVSGGSQITVDGLGRRIGKVFDGGKVVVNAQRGFFASQAGSLINVSGSQDILDLPGNSPAAIGASFAATLVGSHAGSINVTAAEGAFLDGDMQAAGGVAPGTSGGKLSVFLNVDNRRDSDIENSIFPRAPRILKISQERNVPFSAVFSKPGDSLPKKDSPGDRLTGIGYLAAEQISEGGFSSVDLAVSGEKGEIRFTGDVDLQLNNAIALDAVNFGWERNTAADTGNVQISATTATLGSDSYRAPLVKASNGDGRLAVNADLIDLVGGSVTTGFNTVDLAAAGDIRLKGIRIDSKELDFVGEFKTFSKLNLTAAQVYPTSLTEFTLAVTGDPNGTVTFNKSGSATPVLSALGSLTVQGPNIVQNGVLTAPLGEIVLDATKSVTFGADSVTSVSAKGQIIPLGVTQGGLEWLLPLAGTGNNLNVVNPDLKPAETDKKRVFESPEKKITVKAAQILREDGALVDLSGGGDLLGFEFIPGDGGSVDVLDTDQRFAVVPGMSGYSPFDPKSFPESGLKTGDSIYIGAGSGLAAGYYALLPARYALLPDAFLVAPVAGSANAIPGTSRTRVDGAAVVTGYRSVAGTDIRDQYWSEFVVEAGSIAKTRSEYNISSANQFFADRAVNKELAIPRLPQDAGQLVLNAKTRLELPTVVADVVEGGRGGLVDIVADKLALGTTAATDDVELLVSDLDKFRVDSLLLGAVRSFDATTGHTKLDVIAKSVTLAQNTTLKAPEALLAASETVTLEQGAKIEASGAVADTDGDTVLELNGDGALLRASAGKQATINRTGAKGLKGDLTINAGAIISAGAGSVALDSTRRTKMAGELNLAGGSLYLGAETINLGETAGVANGLSLDNTQLAHLTVNELVLSSRGMVNLYGELLQTDALGQPFQFGDLRIDALGLAGKANAGKTLSLNVKTLSIANSKSTGSVLAGDGGGVLNINVQELLLDQGKFQLSGFAAVNVNAGERMMGKGDSTLTALADLSVSTPYVSAENGAKTIISASGHNLSLTGGSQVLTASTQGIAAQLLLEADSIGLNTALLYQTGNVFLNALQGNVTLGGNALIDVSGAVAYAGLSKPVNLSGGKIGLSSQHGNVSAEAGSKLLLNASNADMLAGLLSAQAGAGQVQFNGFIDAHGVGKANGGRVAIDTGSLSAGGFSVLNAVFTAAGFSGAVELRTRSGDIVVEAGQTVSANAINLSADTGSISIAGTLDAAGANGGSVTLAAEDLLTLNSSALILANAQAVNGNGGKVSLSSIDGATADGAGIEIQSGARINVAAAGTGAAGEVYLRADREDTDGDGLADINVKAIAAGTIVGDSDVTVEGARIYHNSRIASAEQQAMHNDNLAYMADLAAANVANSRFGAGFTIIPGVEVRSSGNLTIAETWDLGKLDSGEAWRYGANNDLVGVLTLRAKGNLLINANLSDGFSTGVLNSSSFGPINVSDYLQTGASWSYQLIGGADLGSADAMTVLASASLLTSAGSGDVSLANDVSVRTGTGDIDIRAARDLVYGNQNSAIYTAGRADVDDAKRWGSGGPDLAALFYAEYPLDGGDISIQVGRDIDAKPSAQLLSDALVRTGDWSNSNQHSTEFNSERPTAWGVALGISDSSGFSRQHQQSVTAFGGGNVRISAGGNVEDLSVMVPTTGKQVGERDTPVADATVITFKTNVVEVNGGGNLQLQAGGDIAGGVFYVDGGAADIYAHGSLKAGTNKGLNPILALGDAQFNVVAGKSMALEAIVDPMFVTLPESVDLINGSSNRFFRYSTDSNVTLTTLSGDLGLENDIASLKKATNTNISEGFLVYPAGLQAYALNGNIAVDKSFTLYPSAQGDLELFAAENLTGKGNPRIILSDAEPAALPSAALPFFGSSLTDLDNVLKVLDIQQPQSPTAIHASTPLHANDPNPVLISTGTGNIGRIDDDIVFVLAKPAEVSAGKDIVRATFNIQHNNADAVSIFNAGRDIRYTINIHPDTGNIIEADQGIDVAGPGQLTALAGRDVNLGSSIGITSSGDQSNAALADDGANIAVIAGLAGGALDSNGFAEGFMANSGKYVLENQRYLNLFVQEMRSITGDPSLSVDAAKLVFSGLSTVDKARLDSKLLSVVQSVFLQEVKANASTLAKATTKQAQDLAELKLLATIESLFPGTTLLAGNSDYRVDAANGIVVNADTSASNILNSLNAALQQKIEAELTRQGKTFASASDREKDDARELVRPKLGNISLFLSSIQTKDGGDANLFTPNGGITVGLATADIGLAKEDDELGVIVKKQGEANLLARNDIDVNIQRVVTLGNGNITGGSTEGDVDAGRSAQTALAAPPLKVSYDAAGMPVLEVSPVLQGGGIRTVGAGDVLLFAPRGIIDAGEAGIRGNNITLAATAIVGADNIDVGGSAVGVPVAATGSIAAGLTGVSNVAAAVGKSLDSTGNVGKDAAEKLAKAATNTLGILSVDILGFGE